MQEVILYYDITGSHYGILVKVSHIDKEEH